MSGQEILVAPPQNDPAGSTGPARVSERMARLPLALTAMALWGLAVWILQQPYLGVIHDSTLYSLFALTRLHPEQLANDIFLRFGSQDRYTLFTPIYAAAINSLGLEHAASLLTLVFQGALFGCAWLLARRFMPPLAAALGVGLLAAAPGEYGSHETFHIVEGFLTPRLPAEALAVGGLVAALGGRYWLAAACVAAAMSLHPIIGCAGAAILILTFVAPLRPRLFAVAAGAGLLAGIAAVLAWHSLGRLEGMWLYTVRVTSTYLFLRNWSYADWSRIAGPLAILAIGALRGTTPLLRRLCAAALAMVGCGLLISFTFGDLLQVPIFIGAQTWRWLWLANLLAFVLTPLIAQQCWSRGDAGRSAILLLAAAWMFRGTPPALYLVPLAIAAAVTPTGLTTQRYWRLAFLGTCIVVGLASVLDAVDHLWYMPGLDPSAPVLPQRLRAAFNDGAIPAAVLIGAYWMLGRWESTRPVIAATAALACGALLPLGWQEWTYSHYTPELAAKFAPWRAGIPVGTEVLWPDTPVGSWYLLGRPNYWSPHQSAGAIFSRDKAVLLDQRTQVISKAMGKKDTKQALEQFELDGSATRVPAGAARIGLAGMVMLCSDPALGYIVSWMPVAPTPFPPVTVDARKLHGKLYLYRCSDLLH